MHGICNHIICWIKVWNSLISSHLILSYLIVGLVLACANTSLYRSILHIVHPYHPFSKICHTVDDSILSIVASYISRKSFCLSPPSNTYEPWLPSRPPLASIPWDQSSSPGENGQQANVSRIGKQTLTATRPIKHLAKMTMSLYHRYPQGFRNLHDVDLPEYQAQRR